MRNVRDVKQGVNQYLDQTRPKRQKTTGYFAFFLISLFVAYIFGRTDMAKEVSAKTNVPNVNAANTCALENTSKEIAQYNCSLPAIFPNPEYQNAWSNLLSYCEIIENTSIEWGLDPELIAAVIMVESGGNAKALSTAGAVGLMQVMPSDGPAGAKYESLSNRSITADLFDPINNINEGVKILHNELQKTDDLWDALYNYVGGHSEYPDWVISIYQSLLSN